MASRGRTEAPSQEQPLPPRPALSVKGGRDGLRLTVRAGATAEEAGASLRDQISRRAGAFFLGAQVVLDLPGPALDLALAGVLAPIITEGGMRLVAVQLAGAPVERREVAAKAPASAPAAAPADAALVVAATLRSGQRVAYAGSVVVLGDVNAGAEVVAGAHVLVWGRLRGVVEAGQAEGSPDARVAALDLVPTQLRIGPAVARAPDEPGRSPVPEVARLVDGRIVVESWR
jgi:septum site-determining protein MinC